NDPELFAISRSGAWRGTWTLDVNRGDWEDIAISTDPATGDPLLWIGDVGDNGQTRESVQVHRIKEPKIPEGEPGAWTLDEVDTITLLYPDGPRNCETLLVDPLTQDLYVVTKSYDGDTEIYRKAAPHRDEQRATLEYITTFVFGVGDLPGNKATTGGDFSPDGALLAIRTYGDTAYLWRRDPAGTVDRALTTAPCPVPIPSDAQGEAICFDDDGQSLITVSEHAHEPIQVIPLE
ncbi:MAG: PE family protein, partial [Alphaproteobacteria bacterium]|nr:PE family protein [Alphaproteobacteria bacterium]